MTWQDELIELETRLASGALSAEEYRRARDELLAQSQSQSSAQPEQAESTPEPQSQQQPPQPPQQPPGQQQSSQPPPSQQPPSQQPPSQPAQTQHGSAQQYPSQQRPASQSQEPAPGPFPPPFQWGQQSSQPPGQPPQSQQQPQQQQPPQQPRGMDSTQVIRAVGSESREQQRPERTEVVRPSSDPDRTQAVSDPDRTQTVSGLNRQRPSHGRDRLNAGQQGATPNWGRRADQQSSGSGQQSSGSGSGNDDETPWGGESPVVAPSSTWMKQGPESFEAEEPAKRGKMVGAVVAGVLVLALAVVAVIYFSNGNTKTDNRADEPQQQAPQHTTMTTTSSTPPLPKPPPPSKAPSSNNSALVRPPGKTRGGGGPLKAGELKARNFFAAQIVNALTSAGFSSGTLKTTTDNGTTVGLYSLTVRDQSAAKNVAKVYADVQNQGDIPATDDGAQQGVHVFANDESDGEHYRRAVYVLYNRVIVLDVSGDDTDSVRSVFNPLLAKQVKHQPPTVRDSR